MITIVGTGHIFDLSDRIHRVVQQYGPDLVAVELDRKRQAVLQMERRNRENGINPPVTIGMLFRPSPIPFRFRILGYIQKKMAAANNVFPGEEMLSAMDAARLIGVKIALIDRDINGTLSSLNRAMSTREKMRFYVALFTGFTGIGVRNEKRTIGSMIEEIESDYDSIIQELATQFPGMKKALIDERDQLMAHALFQLQKQYPNILAFVGEAHVEGMSRLLRLNGAEPEVIHLNSFMKDGMPQSTHSVNIRIH